MADTIQRSPIPISRTPVAPLPWRVCTPRRKTPSRCHLSLNPPPKRPDPWIYETSVGQVAQFLAWQKSGGSSTPPTFWIPDAAWQLANPGWINPIQFWLPQCGINVYSSYDPNFPGPSPSPVIEVTLGNDTSVTAINTLVRLSASPIGIGRKKVPVAEQLVTVGPNQQVTVTFVTPPAVASQQWLGAYVDLYHPFDQNQANDQAISMWQGIDTTGSGGPGSIVSPAIIVVNEFSANTEQITLTIIPFLGVGVSNVPGPITLAPGQSATVQFDLTISAVFDGGSFLAPMATVVGLDAKGDFVGGFTIVGFVSD